ncbi:MAG: hypothetical protein IIU63_00325 [Clostridia bacterium]|nr:hypothetical protein [Clostridia bacterium]
MKRSMMLIALSLVPVLCFAACDTPAEEPIDTTAEITTEEPTTEQVTTEEITTEEPTTEEPTTEEITTEAQLQTPVSIEAVKEAALTFVDPEMIKAYAENPDNDWSDFGGMTFNEDGSVKALYRYGADDHWDPYCYLVKDYVPAGNIAVIQYRCEYNFGVNLYIGSEGNVATGPAEHVQAAIYASKDGEWKYLVVNLADDAMCYDNDSGVLGFLRFGLDDAEAGDTVDFGFVAFFHNIDEAAKVLPVSLPEE